MNGLAAPLTPPAIRSKAAVYSGLSSVTKIVFTATTTAAIATSAPRLRRRTSDIFPAGYLTGISIVQGVALAVLMTGSISLPISRRLTLAAGVAAAGQSATGFATIVIVSYEYLWFTTIMRWSPNFLDTLVPYVLGAAEIAPLALIGHTGPWWIAMTAFMFAAAGAFAHTIVRLSDGMFAGTPQVQSHIRVLLHRLLARLAGCCLALMAICAAMTSAFGVAFVPGWLPAAMPWTIIGIGAYMVVLSEQAMNAVYREYQVPRSGMFRIRGQGRRGSAARPGSTMQRERE